MYWTFALAYILARTVLHRLREVGRLPDRAQRPVRGLVLLVLIVPALHLPALGATHLPALGATALLSVVVALVNPLERRWRRCAAVGAPVRP